MQNYWKLNGFTLIIGTFEKQSPGAPFFERPANFSGMKANFKIKTSWIVAQFLAHKPISLAFSTTDSFIVSFPNFVRKYNANAGNTKQLSGPETFPGLSRNGPLALHHPSASSLMKGRVTFRAGKAILSCCVFIQDRSFNNFESATMKLSVKEAKLTGLWARNWTTIQQVLILKFAFGPQKFPGLWRNEPQARNVWRKTQSKTRYSCSFFFFRWTFPYLVYFLKCHAVFFRFLLEVRYLA